MMRHEDVDILYENGKPDHEDAYVVEYRAVVSALRVVY